jgi:hypothetical protein
MCQQSPRHGSTGTPSLPDRRRGEGVDVSELEPPHRPYLHHTSECVEEGAAV